MHGTSRSAFAISAVVGLSLLSARAQQSALRPHSMYEPPMAAAAATLTANSANVPADLLTTGEKTQWRQTERYDEAVRIMRRLATLSPQVKVIQFGTTAQGRPMYAMIASSDIPVLQVWEKSW